MTSTASARLLVLPDARLRRQRIRLRHLPVDPEYRDENGELMWCSDDEDEDDDEFEDDEFLDSEFAELDDEDEDEEEEVEWFLDDEAPSRARSPSRTRTFRTECGVASELSEVCRRLIAFHHRYLGESSKGCDWCSQIIC